jgi:hypothetical protein
MIQIDISYHDATGRGHVYDFWRNLIKHIHETDQDPEGVWRRVGEEVAKYKGRFRDGHIVFHKDRDATLFLLRWS